MSPSQFWNIASGLRQGDRLWLVVAERLAVALDISLDCVAAMGATRVAISQPAPPKRQRTRQAAPVARGVGRSP